MSQLLNQAIGDAVSDMLMVEAILIHKKWRCEDWIGMYRDLPNRQLKVKVSL
jgi:phosphoacetylglucosamine mutase